MPDDAPRAAFAVRPVLLTATGLLALLLALAGRYGPHRDELYFVAAGRRLAWGYPDQPPLTPLLARAADVVAPGSLLALHAVPALMAAATVVVAALTARELGGGRAAQLLTALAVATGAVTAIVGHMLTTATTDMLLTAVVVWLAVRTLVRDAPRGWLLVGLAGGVGLHNKHLVAFVLGTLVVGAAVTPAVRHHLRSPWAWAGVAVAVALWAPNLAWQAAHGWPQLELAADIRDEYGTVEERLGYVLLLLVLLSPVATWLAVRGTVRLWREPALVRARPLAVAAVLLVVVFALTGGKAYYLAGVLPALVAAGADGWARRDGFRLPRAAVVVALAGMVTWPATLPLLPAATFGSTPLLAINEDGGETVGWRELVATTRDVVAEHDAALVLTANYGEAGALEWYGVDVPVDSGHNGYGDWGPPPDDLVGPVVVLGYRQAPPFLEGCERVATVENDADLPNEEHGGPVHVCEGPVSTWAQVWPDVRHLSA